MSFEKIKTVSEQILNRVPAVRGKGEQATKQSLVLPMLDALGYDIWNPSEVCLEYDADFAIRKAGQKEKVDIAIICAGLPRIYIETKSLDDSLDGHEGQLSRYFNSTRSAILGILTNGIEWRFFTDTGDPNVMDSHPFHVTRLDSVDQGLDVLARFAKSVFSADAIRDYATQLLYTAKIAGFLRQELDLKDREPGEYFVRWILKADRMYDGVVNSNVVERFRPIVKDALTRVVREIVRRSITAMEHEAAQPMISGVAQVSSIDEVNNQVLPLSSNQEPSIEPEAKETERPAVVTTENELRAFEIIKSHFDRSSFSNSQIYDASSRKEIPISLGYKDTTGYFGVYFNKPSWWIIRVYLEGRRHWIGFNIEEETGIPLIPEGMIRLEPSPWANFRIQISSPEDIDKLHRLTYAAFEKVIGERSGVKDSNGKYGDGCERVSEIDSKELIGNNPALS